MPSKQLEASAVGRSNGWRLDSADQCEKGELSSGLCSVLTPRTRTHCTRAAEAAAAAAALTAADSSVGALKAEVWAQGCAGLRRAAQ